MKNKAEKAPPKKKAPKIAEIKKSLIIGSIIAATAIAGIVGGIYFYLIESKREKEGILKIGITKEGIWSIDPLEMVTAAEEIIVSQVTETLFDNVYIGSESEIIGTLATDGVWNDNATEFTCYLREGVEFHDGTPFNATVVKWNFDRATQIIDPWGSWLGYLYFLPDGRWIVNETQVIDPYTVKFVLNEPFVPFKAFLTHPITSILSPTSTPATKTLNCTNDNLVGTGPFIYNRSYFNVNLTLYTNRTYWDVNLTLYKNQNYWGIKPKIDEIILTIYDPTNIANQIDAVWNALLAGEIHMLDWNFLNGLSRTYPNRSFETFKNDPGIIVQETPSTSYRYVKMDNKLINITMRKAISYAINYSSILEKIDNTVSLRSPIPEGILYSNTTAFNVPYYNLSKARQILIDEGWPGTAGLTANDNITAGNEWEQLITDGKSLATYNFSYIPVFDWSITLSSIFQDNLKQIGVNVTSYPWAWPYQLEVSGFTYDYNDPHNGIFADYHSEWTWIPNFNVSAIDELIEEGLKETDPILRKGIYHEIQRLLIEEIFPVVLISSNINFDIYRSNLKGWQVNPFKTVLKTVKF